jgi:cell division septation protein DedD
LAEEPPAPAPGTQQPAAAAEDALASQESGATTEQEASAGESEPVEGAEAGVPPGESAREGADPQAGAEPGAQTSGSASGDHETEVALGDEAPAAAPPESPPSGEAFMVHVSSLRTEAAARREARRFENAGYPTLSREEEIAGKGKWVRVYVGPYGERGSAKTVAGEIRASGLATYTRVYRLPEDQLREGMGRGDR